MARQNVMKLLDGRLLFTAREDRTDEFSGRVFLGRLLQGNVLLRDWRRRGERTTCLGDGVALSGRPEGGWFPEGEPQKGWSPRLAGMAA